MEPVVDQRIYSNRYQATHLIARGGTAMVYRAHDLLLNRYVALKILYPELSVDPSFVERFRREAQAAANLSHPNIVPVFDWGEDDGVYFIVMELVEGTSLAELLRDSRTLSPAKSALVCAQAASALSYAHRQGMVHRDVKPGNILLTSDGQVKVTDFGIAQAISTEDHLTAAGSVMGTATYFSPEQAEGALVDGRSDVYSLGIVLYELLAGRPPFMGDSPVAVASKHVRDVLPSPRQFNPSLPSDLEAITLHALIKQPADRYQTADEFRADLLRFTEGQPVSVTGRGALMGDDVTRAVSTVAPMGERTEAVPIMTGPRTDVRRRNSKRPWIIALVALLVLGGAAGALLALNTKTEVFAVPNVVGSQFKAATDQLHAEGFSLVASNLIHSNKPQGEVVRIAPAAGTKVAKSHVITLFVSLGPLTHKISVPYVSGSGLITAQAQLSTAGFNYTVQYLSQGAPGDEPGIVLQQSPLGGTLHDTGSIVTLFVLSPTASYPVPNVAGKSPVAASNTLGNYALNVSSVEPTACSNTIVSGLVVGTIPAQGVSVTQGAVVKLVISSGYCSVIVPAVQNKTQAEASAALTAQNLQPSYNILLSTDPQCIGLSDQVINQNPTAGTSALFNSTVIMDYCPPTG